MIHQIPERFLVIFFSEMCEFMNDNGIDEFGIYIEIFRQSITKTESIFSTATSPTVFGFGDFDTGVFWEFCCSPEFLSSWNDVFEKPSFHRSDF